MSLPDVSESSQRQARRRLLHDRASMLLAASLVTLISTGLVLVCNDHLTHAYTFWERIALFGLVSVPSVLVTGVFVWGYLSIRSADYVPSE